MNIRYTIIYTPQNKNKYDKSDIKYVDIELDNRRKIDEVKKKSQRKVIRTGTLDSYALRKYWEPSGCEVEIINHPWSDISDLKEYILDNHGGKVNNTNLSKMSRSVEFQFEDKNKSTNVKQKLQKEFGDILPVGTKSKLLEISLYQRTNLEIKNYNELENLFSIYDEVKN